MNIDEHSLTFFFEAPSLTEPGAHWLSVLNGWPMSSRDPLYRLELKAKKVSVCPAFMWAQGVQF